MKTILAFAFLSLSSISLAAQQAQHKTKIGFDCTCPDPVGALFATAFRDALANSPRYEETSTVEEKNEKGEVVAYRFKIDAVSIDDTVGDDKGVSTALGLTFLIGDSIYLTTQIQICGRERVSACAQGLLSTVDQYIHNKQ